MNPAVFVISRCAPSISAWVALVPDGVVHRSGADERGIVGDGALAVELMTSNAGTFENVQARTAFVGRSRLLADLPSERTASAPRRRRRRRQTPARSSDRSLSP